MKRGILRKQRCCSWSLTHAGGDRQQNLKKNNNKKKKTDAKCFTGDGCGA